MATMYDYAVSIGQAAQELASELESGATLSDDAEATLKRIDIELDELLASVGE